MTGATAVRFVVAAVAMTVGVSVTMVVGVAEAGKLLGVFEPASGVTRGEFSVEIFSVGVGRTPQIAGGDPQADSVSDKITINVKMRCIRGLYLARLSLDELTHDLIFFIGAVQGFNGARTIGYKSIIFLSCSRGYPAL